jgi:hypothetical protein
MKNPIVTLIIGLIIGFGIGYFVQSKISDSQIPSLNSKSSTVNIAKPYTFRNPEDAVIGADVAKAAITNFVTINNQDIQSGGGLYVFDSVANKTKPLEGFVIQKASIMDMMKTPNWNGLRVYFAKNPQFTNPTARIFTFIVTATTPKVAGGTDNTNDSGPIYDHVYPCPPNCGTLAP